MRVETHFLLTGYIPIGIMRTNIPVGIETEGYAYGNKREDTFLCGGAVLSERV